MIIEGNFVKTTHALHNGFFSKKTGLFFFSFFRFIGLTSAVKKFFFYVALFSRFLAIFRDVKAPIWSLFYLNSCFFFRFFYIDWWHLISFLKNARAVLNSFRFRFLFFLCVWFVCSNFQLWIVYDHKNTQNFLLKNCYFV